MHKPSNALGVARDRRPSQPVTLVRPHAAQRAARFFVEKFPGTSMYAVKANPSPDLIRTLWDSGITTFDVASIAEVRLVRGLLPDATLCFMHPVKPAEAIAEAYRVHGVRTFSLDSVDEVDKIVAATATASDSGPVAASRPDAVRPAARVVGARQAEPRGEVRRRRRRGGPRPPRRAAGGPMRSASPSTSAARR